MEDFHTCSNRKDTISEFSLGLNSVSSSNCGCSTLYLSFFECTLSSCILCCNVCTLLICVHRTRTRRQAATRRQPVARRSTQQRPVITAHSSSSGNDDDDDDYSANEHSSSANSSDADYKRRTKWLTKRMAAQAVRWVSQDIQ